MRGSPWSAALVLLCCAGASCKDDPAPPLVPVDGFTTNRNNPRDAGKEEDGGDEDAGPTQPRDAGTVPMAGASACLKVPVLSVTAEDATGETSTEQPSDFVASRQAELWSTDCSNPQLTIALSDGVCPTGGGHELRLTFSVNDIEDGAVHIGNNAIDAETETSSIRARYTRPIRLKPNGVWGTCNGASGTIVFFEAPELRAGSLFQARYQLELTPCDGSGAAPILVVGTFKIPLSYSIATVCSTRTE